MFNIIKLQMHCKKLCDNNFVQINHSGQKKNVS